MFILHEHYPTALCKLRRQILVEELEITPECYFKTRTAQLALSHAFRLGMIMTIEVVAGRWEKKFSRNSWE